MEKQSYLYFNKDGSKALTMPESSFLGVEANLDNATLTIAFEDVAGEGASNTAIELGFTGTHKAACEALAIALAAGSGIHVIADNVENEFMHPFTSINSVTL